MSSRRSATGGFALSGLLLTFAPDRTLPGRGRFVATSGACDAVGIRTELARHGWSKGTPGTQSLARPHPDGVRFDQVPVVTVPVADALPPLLAADGRRRSGWRAEPDSLRTWRVAAQLGVRLVAAHRLAPTLVEGDDGRVHGVWRALVDGTTTGRVALERLAVALPTGGHAVPRDLHAQTVWEPEELLRAFLDAVADHCARHAADPPRPGRPRERLLPWTSRWVEALADAETPVVPLRDDARELVAGAEAWHAPSTGDAGLVELRLAAPTAGDGDHAADDPSWTLDVGVRLRSGGAVSAAAVWAGTDLGGDVDPVVVQDGLLRGLARAARVFPPLEEALRDTHSGRVALDVHAAWDFIREASPLLEGSDVLVVIAEDILTEPPRLRVRLGDAVADVGAEELTDLSRIWEADAGEVDLRWEVALGEQTMDAAQLDELLASGDPLVRWGDGWVRADPTLVDRVARVRDGTVSVAEALLYGLAGSIPATALDDLDDDEPGVEAVVDGPIARLLERLRDAGGQVDEPSEPEGFVGELRGYQRRGMAWLEAMADLGLGGVLADDMGLGKTIQVIAYCLQRRKGPYLVVCPTSVVGNWARELGRFAPSLEVTRFHGPERAATLDGVTGVVVTSYGVLRRDPGPLAAVDWDVVAFDEAQHIKNPTTTGAKEARRLRAGQVLALTGTPLENRLAELWSLLDLTNRGLLGSRARFGRRFVVPIERRQDAQAASRLRRVVAPFVLRREKRDPEVRSDLPDKIERTVVCSLTQEQAVAYQRAVEEVLGGEGLSGTSAMERRGRVLALLTALKQICNHPAQREGLAAAEGVAGLAGRSGKLAAAVEIVGEATRAGEQVLVFTQFVQMGHLLVAQFAHDLGVDVPFLHGGVSAGRRDELVAAFQGEAPGEVPPVMVVSLRAGGTGLNLTAATHVLHYDRWWNPAVEDQATDRAHRIGQTKTVEVHKLVTAGTLEERIADLLERKRALADSVVGAGEQWITELSEADLHDLVALSAPGEDLEDDELDEAWATTLFEETADADD